MRITFLLTFQTNFHERLYAVWFPPFSTLHVRVIQNFNFFFRRSNSFCQNIQKALNEQIITQDVFEFPSFFFQDQGQTKLKINSRDQRTETKKHELRRKLKIFYSPPHYVIVDKFQRQRIIRMLFFFSSFTLFALNTYVLIGANGRNFSSNKNF